MWVVVSFVVVFLCGVFLQKFVMVFLWWCFLWQMFCSCHFHSFDRQKISGVGVASCW